MKNLLVNALLLAMSIAISLILVQSFEVWYRDKEARRAAKRRRQEGRYE